MKNRNLPAVAMSWIAVLVLALPALTAATESNDEAKPETEGPAISRVSVVTVLVADQDEALQWYVDVLGLEVRTDLEFAPGQRWLTVAPRGQEFPEIALERATGPYAEMVGKSPGIVFETKDCKGDYKILTDRGAEFLQAPQEMPWATQAVLKDLYGTPITLIESP